MAVIHSIFDVNSDGPRVLNCNRMERRTRRPGLPLNSGDPVTCWPSKISGHILFNCATRLSGTEDSRQFWNEMISEAEIWRHACD